MSFFGALALVLATVGLYGVLSYLVLRRTRSIGIQMALGAIEGRVTRSVITQGLKLCLFGIVLGLPAALAVARFFEGFLYGIEPRDPVTFVTVPMALLVVACVACFLPAYRALADKSCRCTKGGMNKSPAGRRRTARMPVGAVARRLSHIRSGVAASL